MRTDLSTTGRSASGPDGPRIVLIEDNPLTVWAIKRALAPSYEVAAYSTLDDARPDLSQHEPVAVICGSPIADEQPEIVCELAEASSPRVIALVSSPDSIFTKKVTLLEKPFDLLRLDALLGEPSPESLASRVQGRIEREICPVCVHRKADGGCTLTERRECPLFNWVDQLVRAVAGVDSDRLADYMERIQEMICPFCVQDADGHCRPRDNLNCPLDLYAGLVVPIVEDELKREKPGLE